MDEDEDEDEDPEEAAVPGNGPMKVGDKPPPKGAMKNRKVEPE